MDKKIYKRNYLKQVIFRIDFEEIELTDLSIYKEQLKEHFDDISVRKDKQTNVEIKTDTEEVIKSDVEIETWQFVNSINNNRFEFGKTHMLLEYFEYKDSTTLQENVDIFCSKLLSSHGVTIVKRIGLRYINEIEISAVKKILDWKKYINNSLIEFLPLLKDSHKTATRILNQIELKNDIYSTIYKYGIWNDKYPNPITNSSFIIDIDCYTNSPIEFEQEGLKSLINALNIEAESIFEMSILDSVRKEMDR